VDQRARKDGSVVAEIGRRQKILENSWVGPVGGLLRDWGGMKERMARGMGKRRHCEDRQGGRKRISERGRQQRE
jgi:hypothetical protein